MDAAEWPTLRTAANSLSTRNRLIFLLYYADRLTIEEIATLLDLTPDRIALGLAEIRFTLGHIHRHHKGAHPP